MLRWPSFWPEANVNLLCILFKRDHSGLDHVADFACKLSIRISAGFDPTIVIIHGNSQNPIPLVYDLMEPLRPVVDQKVLDFALSNTFTPGDFTITKWGGCRLNPRLAKAVAEWMTTINNYRFADCILRPLRKREAH